MNYATDLAKELKNRNNVKRIGNLIGKVLSINPLKIGILNNTVFLDKDNCFICSNLVINYKRNADVEIKAYNVGCSATDSYGDTISSINVNDKTNYDMVVTFKDILKVGDRVLVVAEASDQFYYIVDKVVQIDG